MVFKLPSGARAFIKGAASEGYSRSGYDGPTS
mgnify:CR=1 FL=1